MDKRILSLANLVVSENILNDETFSRWSDKANVGAEAWHYYSLYKNLSKLKVTNKELILYTIRRLHEQ